MQAFEEVFQDNPDVMIRVIQVIMIRLQRVLFTALRNYLGLNAELVQNHMRYKSIAIINSQASQTSRQTAAGGGPNPTTQMPPPAPRESGAGIGVPAVGRVPPSPSRHSREEHTLSDPNPHSHSDASQQAGPNNSEAHGDAPSVDMFQQQHHSVGNLSTRRGSISQGLASPAESGQSQAQGPPNPVAPSIDMRLVQSSAVESMRRELGLPEEDAHIIEPFVEVRELEPNVTLITEGNADDVCIWFVMTGTLAVYQGNQDATRAKPDKSDMLIHFVHPGEIVGGLAMLTGEASAYTIRSRNNSRIAFIRRAAIYQ